MARIIKVKDNNWAFRIVYQDEFKKQKTFYKSGFETKELAEQNALNAQKQFKTIKHKRLKFNELADMYHEYQKKYNSLHTINSSKYVIAFLKKELKNFYADELNAEIIQNYVDKWQNTPTQYGKLPAHGTIEKKYKHIQQILNYGVYYNKIPFHKVKKVKIKNTPKHIAKTLTPKQINTLIEFVKQNYFDIYIPTLLSSYYGLRPEETLALRKQDIDLKNNFINIKNVLIYYNKNLVLQEVTKTESSTRQLPLIDYIKKELITHLDLISEFKTDYICISPLTGELISPQKYYRAIKKCCKLVNNVDIRLYDLRHTFSQISQENNVELEIVSKIMGHSHQYMTSNVYTRMQVDKTKEALEKLNQQIKQ